MDCYFHFIVRTLSFRKVKIPVWKAWWFILSAILLVLTMIFVVFKIRERNQKAIQEYLQRQLDERTREVIQQKDELVTE